MCECCVAGTEWAPREIGVVVFSHSIRREAEQIRLLLPGPSCLYRLERVQSQVFERMAGPGLWKEKPGRQPLEYFVLAHISHAVGWLAGGKGQNSHLRISLPLESCIPGGRYPAQMVLAWVLSHCHTQPTRVPRHRSPFAGFLLPQC